MAAPVSTTGSSASRLGFLPCFSATGPEISSSRAGRRTPKRVAHTLPAGLEPATVDGRHLVTLAALRWEGGRLGVLPIPRFSQVNVRVYARHGDETAVVFLALRVTTLGMGGAFLGFPVRLARARVREGRVDAGGFGVSLAYERRGPAEPSELGSHELGIFEAAGVRAFRVRRGEASWERGEAVGPGQGRAAARARLRGRRPAGDPLRRAHLVRGRAPPAEALDPRRTGGSFPAGAGLEPGLDAVVRLDGRLAAADVHRVDVALGAAVELLLERLPPPEEPDHAHIGRADGDRRGRPAARTAMLDRSHWRKGTRTSVEGGSPGARAGGAACLPAI